MSNEWLIGKNEVNFCYKLYSKINRYDKIIKKYYLNWYVYVVLYVFLYKYWIDMIL